MVGGCEARLAHCLGHLPAHRNHFYISPGGPALRHQLLHPVDHIDIERPAQRRIARYRHDGDTLLYAKSSVLHTTPPKITCLYAKTAILHTALCKILVCGGRTILSGHPRALNTAGLPGG